MNIPPFKYSDFNPFYSRGAKNLKGYECSICGANGVRLYRPYQTFDIKLLCEECACKNEKQQAIGNRHSIGWLVAAVPLEEGGGFWGYTSVPDEGVAWWEYLPSKIYKF